MMFENSFVFAVVPSSTTEKLARGDGDAVNANGVLPLGVASLMILIEPGKMTASAESDRSWLPPLPSISMSRVWYGDPEMATAELVTPQSSRVAMWPPHASTGLAELAVNVIVICVELSLA